MLYNSKNNNYEKFKFQLKRNNIKNIQSNKFNKFEIEKKLNKIK